MIIYLLLVCAIGFAQTAKSPNAEKLMSMYGQYGKAGNKKIGLPKLLEDALLDVDSLITKYGYPVESHTVQTSDGYILKMTRIPKETNASPVFLMHGLLASAGDWIVNGPKKALGYILSDAGYDVWMGNARGNFYSKNHSKLSPNDAKFWDFSWHEIGYYDLPAMIDYVLNYTNQQQVHYVGHSQGTTSFFVMSSMRPKYNFKIKSMNALSPVVYSGNIKSPVIRLLAPIANSLNIITKLFGLNEFLPKDEFIKLLTAVMCGEKAWTNVICSNIAFLIFGYNPKQINATLLPVYLGHTPAGASTEQLVHYAQLMNSGEFSQFDHGGAVNLIKYRRVSPPTYPLKKVTSKIALHYSDNDWLSSTVDVERLFSELSRPIGMFEVTDPDFAHNDYVWGIDAPELVYDKVLKIIEENEL